MCQVSLNVLCKLTTRIKVLKDCVVIVKVNSHYFLDYKRKFFPFFRRDIFYQCLWNLTLLSWTISVKVYVINIIWWSPHMQAWNSRTTYCGYRIRILYYVLVLLPCIEHFCSWKWTIEYYCIIYYII